MLNLSENGGLAMSGKNDKSSISASSVFLSSLSDAGIKVAFVNLGSDHPALLEAFADNVAQGKPMIEVVTCPNEMAALSCAQGYGQATGKPAAVIVHVDVGTQALGGAVHNVDRNRTPVFIFAGASPFTINGELLGSRNEFILSLQDVVDQPQIVRQYMRHVGQINAGVAVAQTVRRAVQFAMTEPKGPVYVWARREAMEQMLSPEAVSAQLAMSHWSEVEPKALAPKSAPSHWEHADAAALNTVVDALLSAQRPYLITSYAGRNPAVVPLLTELVESLEIPVHLANPSVVNLPLDHRCIASLGYGMDKDPRLADADVILVLDADIPYTPMFNKPAAGAQLFHLDVDPLKTTMGVFHLAATVRAQVDTETALEQILERTRGKTVAALEDRRRRVKEYNDARMSALQAAETTLPSDGSFTVPNLLGRVRALLPQRTVLLNEGISNYGPAWNHIRPSLPGHGFTSGAASLGWSLNAAMGVQWGKGYDLALAVVGDGSFLFSFPASAYWIARRYQKPFLTIILHNGGWKSPRYSALAVHPSGQASKTKPSNLHVTFDQPVDYVGVAAAAGGAWGKVIKHIDEVNETIKEAVRVVREEKRCAVIDAWIEHF